MQSAPARPKPARRADLVGPNEEARPGVEVLPEGKPRECSTLLLTEERPQLLEEIPDDRVLESQVIDTLVHLLAQRGHLESIVDEHVLDCFQAICQSTDFLLHGIKPWIHCAGDNGARPVTCKPFQGLDATAWRPNFLGSYRHG
jgi:hypothetical protein